MDETLRPATSSVLTDEPIWANAEDFLGYLEAATGEQIFAERINALLSGRAPALKTLSATARRLVAAECCGFLEGLKVGELISRESWRPYVRWAQALSENDTVITFNYDRVIEVLSEGRVEIEKKHKDYPSGLHVVVPGQTDAPTVSAGACRVLKLHGSVDWTKTSVNGRTHVSVDQDHSWAVRAPDDEIAMATPGPSKLSGSTVDFADLWTLAKTALTEADAIVFVGYRFPETDAYARETLLGAIRENKTKNPETGSTLRAHIVLGLSGESSQHSARLASMLRFVCGAAGRHDSDTQWVGMGVPERRFFVRTHPLFAQDFLSVARRTDLFA
jgi:hypothetical protein